MPSPIIVVGITVDSVSVDESGGTVAFTVRVDNTSVETVTLTSMVDDVHGDLKDQGDCSVPQTIAAGDYYECTFSAYVSGDADDTEMNTVEVTAADDEGNQVTAQDSATVTIIEGLAPPPPPPTLLPAPGLVVPESGARYCEGDRPTLEWQWDERPFQANEYYAIRVWQEGQQERSIHWESDWNRRSFIVELVEGIWYYRGEGYNYYWNIVVLRDTGSQDASGNRIWEFVSQVSETRWFYVKTWVECQPP
jgi:hypothetical protein